MICDEEYIVVNKIKTPDGTILVSKDQHDYVTHLDENGYEYMVDGGNCYLRRKTPKYPYEELSIFSTDPIEVIRDAFVWGTFGKDPTIESKMSYVKLSDLSNPHINAILETQNHIPSWRQEIFRQELVYRMENNIVIAECSTYE